MPSPNKEAAMSRIHRPTSAPTATLADLIELFYNEFLVLYEDEELAAIAAAAVITDLLAHASADATAPAVA